MKKKTVSKAARMIYSVRLKKGYTQLELGRMLGHNYGNFITMIESGLSMVPINMIPQLYNLLDLDPKELLREVIRNKYGETLRSKNRTKWEMWWPQDARIEELYEQEGAIDYLIRKNMPDCQYELLVPYGVKHLKRILG